MTNNKITGKKLEIDDAITSTCITTNQSGNTTRSVLYLLTFVSAISCMALINTFKYGWAQNRCYRLHSKIDSLKTKLKEINQLEETKKLENTNTLENHQNKYDRLSKAYRIQDTLLNEKNNLEEEINTTSAYYEVIRKNTIENQSMIHINQFNTSLDINYLGIISGFAFTAILYALIFTSIREFKNLKLAFISITRRYDDKSDYEYFVQFYEKDKENGYSEEEDSYVKQCNKLRREHHYNFLSMAEIFTIPQYSYDKHLKSRERFQSTLFSYFIFLPPLFCQTIILLYDFHTRKEGQSLSYDLTLATIMLDGLLWMAITSLTIRCLSIKYKYTELWDDFYSKGYKLDLEDHQK